MSFSIHLYLIVGGYFTQVYRPFSLEGSYCEPDLSDFAQSVVLISWGSTTGDFTAPWRSESELPQQPPKYAADAYIL